MYRRSFVPFAVVLTLLAVAGSSTAAAHKAKPKKHPKPLTARQKLARIKHFVVIYQENHSFDNLYGSWEGVNGLANAPAARTTQVNQQGVPFACLRQTDVNLTTPPQPADCTDTTTGT